MKRLPIMALLLCAAFLLHSCSKNASVTNGNSSILGKWRVIYDSTYAGVGINNHPVTYTGQAGDYFDFKNDSIVYTKEGPVADTLAYHFTSGNTGIIQSFGATGNGVPDTCIIIHTNNSITITAPLIITPGGAFGRKVSLQK